MQVVIADTSPINYLVLLGQIDLLPRLYGQIVVPPAVLSELQADGAPPAVKVWVQALPTWVTIHEPTPYEGQYDRFRLDAGELAALRLAVDSQDSLLLIDESRGRAAARSLGVRSTGTLGVLQAAAAAGHIDMTNVLPQLRTLGFRVSQSLVDSILNP